MHWMGGTTSSWFLMAFDHMVQFKDVALELLGAFALAGMGIGGLGSMLFVGKFLKV